MKYKDFIKELEMLCRKYNVQLDMGHEGIGVFDLSENENHLECWIENRSGLKEE